MHRVQEQGDEQGIGGQDEYIDDDHAHGHDDVEVREQPGRCPGAFHQRLVGEEEEKADDTAGQEHRDDAGIEPAQAFALVQPGIDEDGAQAIEGHAGIVRLVQQLPDGRIRGQMALEQDEIDEHDEPGLPVDPLPAHIFQIKGSQRDAGIDAQGDTEGEKGQHHHPPRRRQMLEHDLYGGRHEGADEQPHEGVGHEQVLVAGDEGDAESDADEAEGKRQKQTSQAQRCQEKGQYGRKDEL